MIAHKARTCLIRVGDGRERTLDRGGRLRLGRHLSNDLVLDTPGISRFHARLEWPVQAALPQLIDTCSQNGTRVDSVRLSPNQAYSVRSGARVCLGGTVALSIEVVDPLERAALLPGAPDRVESCFDGGDEERGTLASPQALEDLLRHLEQQRRTGVLELRRASASGGARMFFGDGRLLLAECGTFRGLDAVYLILRTHRIRPGGPPIAYTFSPSFDPQDGEEPLEVWPSVLLSDRHRRSTRRLPAQA